jgi:hypothetical protein
LQVVSLVDKVFIFSEKFHNSALDSFLPANTVQGNTPILIPTEGFKISAVKYVCIPSSATHL